MIFGNSALLNCKWIFPQFLDALAWKALTIEFTDPSLFDKIMLAVNKIDQWIDEKDVTFCNFTFDIEAVLKDQQYYYLGNYNSIKRGIEPPAIELADAL